MRKKRRAFNLARRCRDQKLSVSPVEQALASVNGPAAATFHLALSASLSIAARVRQEIRQLVVSVTLLAFGCTALPPSVYAMPLQMQQRIEAEALTSGGTPPPAIREGSSDRAFQLGKALAARKAIMFGTYWCPYCDEDRQALGRDVFAKARGKELPDVLYVECDARGVDAQADLCRAAGVRSFPTWALSSSSPDATQPFELFPGTKGLRGLERLVGLPSPPEPLAKPPPITTRSGDREIAIAKSLAARGITMYGTYWCGYCDMQRQLFGKEAWAIVPNVECDERSAGASPKKCEAAGIDAFPAWVLPDGRLFKGVLSLENAESLLKDLSTALPAAQTGKQALGIQLPMPSGTQACEDCKVGSAAIESRP